MIFQPKVFIMMIILAIRPLWQIAGRYFPEDEIDLFLFADVPITPQTYGHYFVWFLQSIGMAYLCGVDEKINANIKACFFWIWVSLLISYFFFYKLQLDEKGFITVNTVGFGIFLYYAIRHGRITSD